MGISENAHISYEKMFTIITPTYNPGLSIKPTFFSVFGQNFSDFEYIIVDGKSTDYSLMLYEQWEKKYPTFRYISEKDNGIYDSMNKGVKLAQGDYILFLGAGDTLTSENILASVSECMNGTCNGIYYGKVDFYYKGQFVECYSPQISYWYSFFPVSISHQAIFAPRKLLLKYHFDIHYQISADQDWIMKMHKENVHFFYMDVTVANYDLTGISASQFGLKIGGLERDKIYSKYYPYRSKIYFGIRWFYRKVIKKLLKLLIRDTHNVSEYNRWLSNVTDPALLSELRYDASFPSLIEDAFYRSLTFGTGGLRGIIGPGTNRMNRYVVAQASQGLSNYIMASATNASVSADTVSVAATDSDATNSALSSVASSATATVTAPSSAPSVVIGYDSRIKSDEFACVAASVFAANGIIVHLWPSLTPVPTVSYAVRMLRASAGIMITASHNPAKYNGYKVYGSDGGQITTETARDIQEQIKTVDIFNGVKTMDFDEAIKSGAIQYIDNSVLDSFLAEVKQQSVLYGDKVDRDVSIVYTPLNGTGLIPVTRVLSDSGFTNITLVEEQKNPDGNFPTCPYPNPEIREAMELGLKYAKKVGADLLIATDPDCDRCGIAVKSITSSTSITSGTSCISSMSSISSISGTSDTLDMVETRETQETRNMGDDTASTTGDYVLLTGNEVGLLLLDYICSQKRKHNKMPAHPVLIKTIVTTPLAEKIAKQYGVSVINVLTGFKYIGEQIGLLEEQHRASDYLLGFEESYGYLTGTYVRDKDGVNAAYMIAEMFAFYKTQGKSLPEKLEELYKEYGYCENVLLSYEFPDSAGMERMKAIMSEFRNDSLKKYFLDMPSMQIVEKEDYSLGIHGLPKSNVLKFVVKASSVVEMSSDAVSSDKASSEGSFEASEISVFIRPSGTEPQLKAYINVLSKEKSTATQIAENIKHSLDKKIKSRINHGNS